MVELDDNLWDLSRERLERAGLPADDAAVAAHVHQVIVDNADVVEDPNLIYVGEQFAFPAVGTPPVDAGARGAARRRRRATPMRPAPAAVPPPADAGARPAPAEPPPTPPTTTPPTRRPARRPGAGAGRSGGGGHRASASSSPSPIGIGEAALLSAGVLALLAAPAPASPAGLAAPGPGARAVGRGRGRRAAAAQRRRRRAAAARSTSPCGRPRRRSSTPTPRSPWCASGTDGVVELMLTGEADAAGAVGGRRRRRWTLPGSTPVELLAEAARSVGAPCVALTQLGVDDDGREVLVDLEALGVLSVVAPDEPADAVVRGIAATLATSIFAEVANLVGVGLDDGRRSSTTARPTSSTSVDEALELAATLVGTTASAPAEHVRAAGPAHQRRGLGAGDRARRRRRSPAR